MPPVGNFLLREKHSLLGGRAGGSGRDRQSDPEQEVAARPWDR